MIEADPSDDTTAPQGAPFDIEPELAHGDVSGSLDLGPFERHYETLFAEALEAGEISTGERERLDLAAATLGLEPERVAAVEQALLEAWEAGLDQTLVERAGDEPPSPSTHDDDDDDELPTLALARVSGRPTPPAELLSEDLHARFAPALAQGAIDDAWRLADVLVRRGVANPHQRALWERLRTLGPVRPRHPLSGESWISLLVHADEDRAVSDMFAVIAPGALLGRVAAMRRDGTLPRVAPRAFQDPRTSTVSAVRGLAWAAATLGLRAPPAFLAPEHSGGFEVVSTLPPATRIGARALSGWSASHLAFMCGRHLTWFREEHFICTLVPDVTYLDAIFHAALLLGAPELQLPDELRERARAFAQVISPCLEPAQLAHLQGLVAQFLVRGGRANLRRWSRAAEWTGCRAGLLLSGEIAVAANALSAEPGADVRLAGLEAFWVSDAAGELRRRLGVALT